MHLFYFFTEMNKFVLQRLNKHNTYYYFNFIHTIYIYILGPEIREPSALAFFFQALTSLLTVKVLPPVKPVDPDEEEDTDDDDEDAEPAPIEPIRILLPTGKPLTPEMGSEGGMRISSNQAQRLARALFNKTDDEALKALNAALKPDGAKKVDLDVALLLMMKRWSAVTQTRTRQMRIALRSAIASMGTPAGLKSDASHALASPEFFTELLNRMKCAKADSPQVILYAYLDIIAVVERRKLGPQLSLYPKKVAKQSSSGGGGGNAAVAKVELANTTALCLELCGRRGLLQWALAGKIRIPNDIVSDPQNRFNLVYMTLQPYRASLPGLLEQLADANESKAKQLGAAFHKICEEIEQLLTVESLFDEVVAAATQHLKAFLIAVHSVEALDVAFAPEAKAMIVEEGDEGDAKA